MADSGAMRLEDLLAVARGDRPADTVLADARLGVLR